MKHFLQRVANHSGIILMLFASLSLLLSSCLFGPVTLIEESPFGENRHFLRGGRMAFIYDNEVYLTQADRSIQQLTNSSNEQKLRIALSYNKDKIAYLNADGTPVIIDTTGQLIETLTDFSNIRFLGWSTDDETLWMMGEDATSFQYYGPDMNLPDNPVPSALHFTGYY